MSEFELNLEKYVDVILKVGLNLQRGQRLLIGASIDTPLLELTPFIELIVKNAYKLGARFVDVLWNDPQLHLIRFQHAPRDSFEEFPTWRTNAKLEFFEKGDAFLVIFASTPDLFEDVDPELVKIMMRTRLKHHQPIYDLWKKNATNWTGITAPVGRWAKKVFPDISPDEQISKLWEIIFDICHIKQKDPVSAWKDHIKQLAIRSKYLTKKQYKTLKMVGPGTDLIIGLPKRHIWRSGSMTSQNGIDFVGNIPTEEVFTIPHKDKTEGVVTMTKPVHFQGNLIENIKMTFSRGKVIEFTAGKGKDLLENIIKTDEGASCLGEVALVPNSSPISQTGLLFYELGIDENASNHIALGIGFNFNLKDGELMSEEEFIAAGGNTSMIHIDFMIGSGEMDVEGILENGTSEPIMRKGEWAFKT